MTRPEPSLLYLDASTPTLHTRTSSEVTLVDALGHLAASARADEQRAVCLLWSAERFILGLLSTAGGEVETPDGPAPLGDVYEARCFTPHVELRWLHDRAGKGRAVLLSESPIGDDGGAADATIDDVRAVIDGVRYVLWGLGTGEHPPQAPGWSVLAESRIGSLVVPLSDVPRGARVELQAREYVREYPSGVREESGRANAAVAEERLLGLAVVEREGGQDG